jgi:pyruvate,orthophosphate dikinase
VTKYVYNFTEGSMEQADLLGGKGANLAEMTRLGLPVPPGFIVTTDACRAYLKTGAVPAELDGELRSHLRELEVTAGRRLGDPSDPLLVSVRSGGRFSMPGMMETILNVGLTDASVSALARRTGDERFAFDAYRRLIHMFGRTVHGVRDELFESALDDIKRRNKIRNDVDLDSAGMRDVVEAYRKIFAAETGHDFPQDPGEQLRLAVRSVFESWNSERASVYRRQEHIPDDLGTAVTIMAMVFGNLGAASGTGVAFTRNPATGEPGAYGDYLTNAQGEDVVAGIRNTLPLTELERLNPAAFVELRQIMATLEGHYRDLCDIEFTVEQGKLWMLQTRVGKRTAGAAFIIAAELVDEGVIDLDEALRRVSGAQLMRLMFPTFDKSAAAHAVATGVPASPGAASGRVIFDAHRAAAATGDTILVRRETNPDDLPGIIAVRGILTSRGGKTSHAAVVARGLGKTCVCGAEAIEVDVDGREFRVAGVTVREGDVISIDGESGEVFVGQLPVRPSIVTRYVDGEPGALADPLVRAVDRLLTHADLRRRLGVRANADTHDDAARARQLGAAGIGLCRTEHMFLGDRRVLVERMILADTDEARSAALMDLLPLQRADFVSLFEAMDGLPVVVRLIDPPLHEFLPDLEELTERVATATARGSVTQDEVSLLDAVRRMHEQNPMLGLRGVRLGLVIPGLFAMQVRAIAEAAAACVANGGNPRPEIMVPLVGDVRELTTVRAEAEAVVAGIPGAPSIPIGTMIEVPRAALTAGEIAGHADFFSFGTNDLTQMTWGFSRDDVEGAFFSRYLDLGIFPVSPFESIDRIGIGRLIRMAVSESRAVKPDISIGVCGEHGGDPASVRFFHDAGLDYVSCSPFRIPVARLEAGRAAVLASDA